MKQNNKLFTKVSHGNKGVNLQKWHGVIIYKKVVRCGVIHPTQFYFVK